MSENDYLDFTLTDQNVNVATPKQKYGIGTIRGNVCKYDIGVASVIQKENEVVCEVLEISGSLASSKTFQLYFDSSSYKGAKVYTVSMPSSSLVAKSGGPYTITFSTGASGKKTVVIPISVTGDVIDSDDLFFTLGVDSLGNVKSSSWTISGHNSNGKYVKYSDRTMECRYVSPNLRITTSAIGNIFYCATSDVFVFPAAFKSGPSPEVNLLSETSAAIVWPGALSIPSNIGCSCYCLGATGASSGYQGYVAKGFWG